MEAARATIIICRTRNEIFKSSKIKKKVLVVKLVVLVEYKRKY